MAIIQCIPTSCKSELLTGTHDFEFDEIKIALYEEGAELGPDTTEYTTDDEVSGDGYTAGGATLTGQVVVTSNGSAWVDWSDPTWSGASFYAAGAMLYNASKDNRAVLILSFGTQRLFSGTATITFPESTAATAMMRLT